MENSIIKKIVLFFTATLTLGILIFIFYPQLKNFYQNINYTSIKEKIKFKSQEKWITVFTHGAFGSILGFINTNEVLKDDLQGTRYKKLISKMRKNPYFYKIQPILKKGLIKIKPTFKLSKVDNKKYVAFPVIKAYETIANSITKNKSKNYFYTFGWSGLMSQQRRRMEAVRFYNALAEEVAEYKKNGITPKIRIIAHSHGGNLSLNIASTKKCIELINNKKEIDENNLDKDEIESLKEMMKIMNNLSSKEMAKKLPGQKQFDYFPENPDLQISELIMLGTPIQPETEHFASYDVFDKVFNFYSEDDIVQEFDWVSTKKGYSDQRLKNLKNYLNNKVAQIKIMMNRQVSINEQNSPDGNINQILTLNTKKQIVKQGFWNKLIDKVKYLWETATNDPTHRELWFPEWNKENDISPFPTVVLTPLMVNAIEKISEQINDIDLNINFSDNEITLYVLKHNDSIVQDKISVYRKIIDSIKSKIKKWKPEDLHLKKEFDIISEYSNNL